MGQSNSELYDICIATEDDNEFSPCFIEFMDKGLELFKDDPDIMYLCGYVPEKKWHTEGENKKLFDSIGRIPY